MLQFIWQPEIQVPPIFISPVFHSRHTITTAHLLILTDKQIIVLREDERSQLNRGIRYGGVRHFIPLRSIRSSSLDTTNKITSWLLVYSSAMTGKWNGFLLNPYGRNWKNSKFCWINISPINTPGKKPCTFLHSFPPVSKDYEGSKASYSISWSSSPLSAQAAA